MWMNYNRRKPGTFSQAKKRTLMLQWVQAHQNWAVEEWKNTIKKTFCLIFYFGCLHSEPLCMTTCLFKKKKKITLRFWPAYPASVFTASITSIICEAFCYGQTWWQCCWRMFVGCFSVVLISPCRRTLARDFMTWASAELSRLFIVILDINSALREDSSVPATSIQTTS